MAQEQWYYAVDGVQAGPVDGAELQRLCTLGTVKPTDLVWRDGFAEWMAASKVPQLSVAREARPAASAIPATAAYSGPVGAAPVAAAAVLPYRGPAGSMTAPVSPTAVELLRQTRPWVMLFSVLMFIVAGLEFLGGIFTVFAGALGGIGGGRRGVGAGAGAGVCLGVFPILAGLLYFFPALFLMRYATRIRSLVGTSRSDDLEGALDAQKSFWKFMGILTAVVLIVGLLLLGLLILGGVAAGVSASRAGSGFRH